MPKKLPPHLPLSAFSSAAPAGVQDQLTRRIPLLAIDAHVFLPQSPAGDPRISARLWQDAIRPLCPAPAGAAPEPSAGHPVTLFKGFIHIHPQPAWLLAPAPESAPEAARLAADRWETEHANILRIDKELGEIQTAPPMAQVVWAPLSQGPSVLAAYLDRLAPLAVPVCGCCHLIERKSTTRNASLVDPPFIESLKLLGTRGLTLELMVDRNHERSAQAILDDVLECVSAVRQGQEPGAQTKFVLCQMGMPEMISTQSLVPSSASYSSILSRLFSLSLFADFHIKLSGLPLILEEELNSRACDRFLHSHKTRPSTRELEPATPLAVHEDDVEAKQETGGREVMAQGEAAWREVKKRIKFYLEPILEAFGDHRLIYASGFPYYGVPQASSPAPKAIGRYEYQFEIFRECLTEFGLENGALDNVFGLNAQRCYRI